MDDDKKIDWFGPEVIVAFVAAFMGDVGFFLLIPHYICGIIAFGAIMPKVFRRIPSVLLKILFAINAIIVFILPLPLLTITIFGALLLTNSFIEKFIEEAVEQAAIQAIAVATGGAGEALEGVAITAEASEVAAETAEVAETTAEAGAAGAEAAEAGEATTEAREGGGRPSEESTERNLEENEKASERENTKKQEAEVGEEEEEQTPEEEEKKRHKQERKEKNAEIEEEVEEGTPEEEPNKAYLRKYFGEESLKPDGAADRLSESKPQPQENESTRRLRERFEKAQKIKDQLQKLPRGQQTPEQNDQGEDEENEDVPIAA